MRVIVINKNTFDVQQIENVSSISFSSNTYTITYGSPSTTATFSGDNYRVSILW